MFTIQSNSIQTIKENIMTYFNGTLQEFTYLHEQVTEISNPDESYLGTLNLFFKEPVTSNDEQTYFEYLAKILKDDAIDTWTLREQEEINKLDLTQGLHIFLYDIYIPVLYSIAKRINPQTKNPYMNQNI